MEANGKIKYCSKQHTGTKHLDPFSFFLCLVLHVIISSNAQNVEHARRKKNIFSVVQIPVSFSDARQR